MIVADCVEHFKEILAIVIIPHSLYEAYCKTQNSGIPRGIPYALFFDEMDFIQCNNNAF